MTAEFKMAAKLISLNQSLSHKISRSDERRITYFFSKYTKVNLNAETINKVCQLIVTSR
jgi:hypothetical protein